jgi:hypothetical protein
LDADEGGHGGGVVVEHHAFLQVDTLECSRHPDTEAERAMLEEIEPHHRTRSAFRFAAAGFGAHFSGRPWQQCAVRYSTSPFMAANCAV